MKKFGLVVLAATCMALAVAGCGSDVETDTKDITPPQPSVEQCEQEEGQKESVSEETTPETQKAEEPSIQDVLKDTPWKLVLENTFDFKCYDAMGVLDNIAVAVGYSGEIHYFEQSDSTWPKAENESLCRFGLDFVDSNICYTCGNGGNITKSVDGGKTFVKKTNFVTTEAGTMISFIDENTGIVANKKEFGITKDGAETWTKVTLPGIDEVICIKMETPDKFYYIDNKLTLNKTEDGGTTWTSVPLNLPEGEDYMPLRKNIELVINGDDTYTIYCVQKSSKMIKSYTTTDQFVTYTENPMPELKVSACYIHVKGDYLSFFNSTDKSLTVLSKSAK